MQPEGNFHSGSCEITPSMSQDFIAPWELHCQVGFCHSGILGIPFHSRKVTNITKKFTGGKNSDYYQKGRPTLVRNIFLSQVDKKYLPPSHPYPSTCSFFQIPSSHAPHQTVFSLLRRKLWTDHVTSPLLQSPPLLLPKTNSMVASRWQASIDMGFLV